MKIFQKIKMLTNKYAEDGITEGAVGYILEIYDQNYCEVEFSDADGNTIAVQAINKDDFIVIDAL